MRLPYIKYTFTKQILVPILDFSANPPNVQIRKKRLFLFRVISKSAIENMKYLKAPSLKNGLI